MIDERHLTEEGFKAAMEAQQRLPRFDYPSGLGSLLTDPPAKPPRQREHYNGTVGAFTVTRLKNIIGVMKANGYNIDIWIGSGWVRKPFTITAFPEDIKIVERNLQE
jgi:hypothetical protein